MGIFSNPLQKFLCCFKIGSVFCFDGKHAWKHTAAWTGYLLFFPPWEGLVIYVKVDGDKQQTLNKNPSDEFLVNVF
jgi:hypothetical protein